MALIHVCFLLLAGHNICLVALCFFEVSFYNHIHMTFVIYNIKACFFIRVLFTTLYSFM